MAAFAAKIEDDTAITPPNAMIPQVMMRPVGAQAITVKRDPTKVLQNLKTFAAAAGENWYYRWQVKNKRTGQMDTIEGPSVKLANDLARLYGNCTAGVVRVDETPTHWVIFAQFVDFETGYEYVRPFQQRKSQTAGERMDAERMRDIAFQIGTSKAIRNAVVNALGTFSDFALDEAKQALVARVARDLDRYRDRAVTRLHELGVPIARVERMNGRTSADWDAATVAKIIAEIQAINEGMATAAEMYPDPDALPPQTPSGERPSLEKFADGTGAQPAPENAPAPGKTENRASDPVGAKKPSKPKGGEKSPPENKGPAKDHPEKPAEPTTGEERVPLDDDAIEMPSFLNRRASGPDPVGPAPVDKEAIAKLAREKHPTMSKVWHNGYIARACGAGKTEFPQDLPPMAVRHWGAGWDARDLEEMDDAK